MAAVARLQSALVLLRYNSRRVPAAPNRREFGLRLIIAYKFVRAPLMLMLALWLTFEPQAALRSLTRVV